MTGLDPSVLWFVAILLLVPSCVGFLFSFFIAGYLCVAYPFHFHIGLGGLAFLGLRSTFRFLHLVL